MPSFLHRVYGRCTRQVDIDHHIGFMKNILRLRHHDMKLVNTRFKRFHAKRLERKKAFIFRGATVVTYDAVTKVHVVTRNIICKASRASGLDIFPFVCTSLPKLKNRLFSKRLVL